MAKVKRKKRDYKRERQLAIKRGETGVGSKSGDAQRHRARRIVEKKSGNLPSNSVVDHIKRVRDGGSNDPANLRVRDLSSNAADGGRVGDAKAKGVRKKK